MRDQEKYAQLDALYQIGSGSLTDLKFGARYTDHTRKSEGVIGQGPGAGAFDAGALPSTFSLYPSDFGGDIGSGFPTSVWYFTPEQLAAFNATHTNRDPITRADWTGDYALKEKDSAAYIQADFDGQGWAATSACAGTYREDVVSNVGTSATRGLITTSFGPYLRLGSKTTTTSADANVKFGLQDDLLLRLAAARRHAAGLLSARCALNLTFQPEAPDLPRAPAAAGPNLKPVKSNNFARRWNTTSRRGRCCRQARSIWT